MKIDIFEGFGRIAKIIQLVGVIGFLYNGFFDNISFESVRDGFLYASLWYIGIYGFSLAIGWIVRGFLKK